jgi:hypothetical protein
VGVLPDQGAFKYSDWPRVRGLPRWCHEIAATVRLTSDLGPFARTPISREEAEAGIAQRLASRERRWLALMDREVFARPRHAYARLLAISGCTRGDLRNLVESEGLEGALGTLGRAGVYLTFDEFKGRRIIVRGSQVLWVGEGALDNRRWPAHLYVLTSGSGGKPTRVPRALPMYDGAAAFLAVALAAHGLTERRHALWLNAPIDWLLMHARLGHVVDAWFHPQRPLPWRVRAGSAWLSWLGRRARHAFPSPRFVDASDPTPIVEWLMAFGAGDATVVVNATVSGAIRIAAVAGRMGASLDRVAFITEGEPLTPSRRAAIEASGARAIGNYASMELNTLGYSCATVGRDEYHFATDRYGVVQRGEVGSLMFSTLDATEPMIALNVELGDSATIAVDECECGLGALGFQTRLRDIFSDEKMSTEGVTIARSAIVPIVESTLPSLFGGSALDYQLAEDEDGSLVLRVNPCLGDLDAPAVQEAFLRALSTGDVVQRIHADLLRRARAVVVVREAPARGRSGKQQPVLLGRRRGEAGG